LGIALAIRVVIVSVSNVTLAAIFSLAERQASYDVLTIVLLRMLFGFILVYVLIDTFKSKTGIYINLRILGVEVLFINICVILNWSNWFTDFVWLSALIVYAMFLLGFELMGHIYLSEAFPFVKKPWSIAFVLVIEHIVHIGLILLGICIPLEDTHYLFIGFGFAFIILSTLELYLPDEEIIRLREEREAERRKSETTTTILTHL